MPVFMSAAALQQEEEIWMCLPVQSPLSLRSILMLDCPQKSNKEPNSALLKVFGASLLRFSAVDH